jgi:hypothetical protein
MKQYTLRVPRKKKFKENWDLGEMKCGVGNIIQDTPLHTLFTYYCYGCKFNKFWARHIIQMGITKPLGNEILWWPKGWVDTDSSFTELAQIQIQWQILKPVSLNSESYFQWIHLFSSLIKKINESSSSQISKLMNQNS